MMYHISIHFLYKNGRSNFLLLKFIAFVCMQGSNVEPGPRELQTAQALGSGPH
jgi:hypothetical protein